MTIIGIGGCMGLMLVGFGLKDSITNIATLQYGELQEYDGMAYLSSDLSEQEKMSLRETLEGEHQIDTYSEVMMKNKTVKSAAGEEEIYLSVPVKEHGLEPFMTFRNRFFQQNRLIICSKNFFHRRLWQTRSIMIMNIFYFHTSTHLLDLPAFTKKMAACF